MLEIVRRTQVPIPARLLVVGMCLSVALQGCKDDNPGGDDGSPSNVVFPTSNVSYAQQVQILFNQTCTFSGCHSGSEPNTRSKLDSYENVMFGVNGLRIVVPGSPDASELVFRIDGRVPQRMPPSGNLLNQNQVNGIRTWIVEGARRN